MSTFDVPTVSTWAIEAADGGARRPTTDDLGGAELVDDVDFPPAMDGTMLFAAGVNQERMQTIAAASMQASVRLTVAFTAGTPSIVAIMSAAGDLVAGDFTLTDNGIGDTSISWATGLLPAMVCDPEATTNGSSAGCASPQRVSGTSIRVRTATAGGASTDIRFTVSIY